MANKTKNESIENELKKLKTFDASYFIDKSHFEQNYLVLIFAANMGSSTHIDNKKKDILVLRKGPTQGLEHTPTAEKIYSINFTVTKKKFCLSLH